MKFILCCATSDLSDNLTETCIVENSNAPSLRSEVWKRSALQTITNKINIHRESTHLQYGPCCTLSGLIDSRLLYVHNFVICYDYPYWMLRQTTRECYKCHWPLTLKGHNSCIEIGLINAKSRKTVKADGIEFSFCAVMNANFCFLIPMKRLLP